MRIRPRVLFLVASALAAPTFDLELRDAELHGAIRLVADVCALDVVVPDTVQGRVTVRLRDVRCDTALEVLLLNEGLVAVPTGRTLAIRGR